MWYAVFALVSAIFTTAAAGSWWSPSPTQCRTYFGSNGDTKDVGFCPPQAVDQQCPMDQYGPSICTETIQEGADSGMTTTCKCFDGFCRHCPTQDCSTLQYCVQRVPRTCFIQNCPRGWFRRPTALCDGNLCVCKFNYEWDEKKRICVPLVMESAVPMPGIGLSAINAEDEADNEELYYMACDTALVMAGVSFVIGGVIRMRRKFTGSSKAETEYRPLPSDPAAAVRA
eukprot:gnl/TRDRNA2_/TRDRNA2_70034_c0_seq1.p1 gnl/TRDRNA2_/TRDRNA2_70034_c0~~gnl/TRDRNA2_/TRDRNA2_70034_c0_seq1.p1  ORF type:complete len:228 (+),score=27.11 gnl/TRDRNA2_/TRDRNA2_70034_c0_seq1:69-752(+)